MYAIVRTGGKQYRVEKGQRLLVERMSADQGSEVALEPLMLRSDETVFDEQGLSSVKVTAKVLAHVRGEKLRVFKFKPKRGYRRRTGHRQDLTHIEVTDIAQARAKPAAGRSAAGETVADGSGAAADKPKRAAKATAEKGRGAAKGTASGKRAAAAKPGAASAKRGAPGAAKASKAKPEPGDGA
jgi:large subunit ribosomal protein L21